MNISINLYSCDALKCTVWPLLVELTKSLLLKDNRLWWITDFVHLDSHSKQEKVNSDLLYLWSIWVTGGERDTQDETKTFWKNVFTHFIEIQRWSMRTGFEKSLVSGLKLFWRLVFYHNVLKSSWVSEQTKFKNKTQTRQIRLLSWMKCVTAL